MRQTIVSFPYRCASSSVACRVASEVSMPRITSISFICGGGLNQWLPITRSGLPVNAASFEIGNCDVFDAKITSSRQTASRRRSTSAFASISSITLSITWSASRGGLLEARRPSDTGAQQRRYRPHRPSRAHVRSASGRARARRRRRRRSSQEAAEATTCAIHSPSGRHRRRPPPLNGHASPPVGLVSRAGSAL